MKYPLPAIVGPYVRLNGVDSNSSELRGSEHLTAGGEGVQAPGAPGAEEGSQGHLAVAAGLRAGAAADLPADHQGPQTSLGSVVVGGRRGFGHEDEQFPVSSTGQALDELLDASAQLALHRRWIIEERAAPVRQRRSSPSWARRLCRLSGWVKVLALA